MKYAAKYTKRLKQYSAPILQSNPYLLSAKSSFRLVFKRKKEYDSYNYPLLITSGPYIWWNSARNHTKNLKNNGLERYEKTLANTIWARGKYNNSVFAISFDQLIKNTEESINSLLEHAGLEFSEIATYPSRFPAYANDNSTFGHKKTMVILKDKIKRAVDIPAEDRSHIKTRIYPLYEKVLESCTINPVKN